MHSSLFSVLLLASPFATRLVEDGAILSESVYSFPPFEAAPGYVPGKTVGAYWSEEAYRAATEDPRFELRKIHYESAGLDVVAYLYAPHEPETSPLPTVVFNRGSFIVGDLAPVLVPLFHNLAGRGYAIRAPLYRGSDGGAGVDEMGGEDMADLMNVVPLAKSIRVVDAANLFLVGESRGGMMTYQALRGGFPARAAATYGAFTDLAALMDSDPRYQALAPRIWPDFEARAEGIITSRSAIQWADELTTPLLIMHGGTDTDINPSQSLRLALALQEAGKTYELHVYAGDGHTLQRNKVDALDRIADWFDPHRAGARRDQ